MFLATKWARQDYTMAFPLRSQAGTPKSQQWARLYDQVLCPRAQLAKEQGAASGQRAHPFAA